MKYRKINAIISSMMLEKVVSALSDMKVTGIRKMTGAFISNLRGE